MAKSRFLAIWVFLLIGAILLGGEVFTRIAVEEGLSRSLQVPVRMRRLSFSPSQITLHGVRFASSSAASSPLAIEHLRIEGSPFSTLGRRFFRRSWKPGMQETLTITGLTLSVSGVPLNAGGRVRVTAQAGKPAWCEGWLTLKHPLAKGKIEISGPLVQPVVYGWLEGGSFGRRNFIGKLSFAEGSYSLTRMEIQGGWAASGSVSLPGETGWRSDWTVSGEGQRYELHVSPLGAGVIHTEFLLHHEGEPTKKISASWRVRRSRLELEAQLLRDEARLDGSIELKAPHAVDLSLDFRELDLEEMADWYLSGMVSSPLSGRVNGKVKATGPPGRLASDGELFGEEGALGAMKFKTITLRFHGQGPILRLHDSQIIRQRGAVSMEGSVDLRKIGHDDFFREVKLQSQGQGIEFMGLELPFTSNESVSLRIQGEEEILSVEHRRKF